MRIIIVGHGPSAFEEEHDIDSYDTVIRITEAPLGGTFGTKTTAIVGSKLHHQRDKIPYWMFTNIHTTNRKIDKDYWLKYLEPFKLRIKPSNGLCAMFAVKEFLDVDEITAVGFDMMRDCPEAALARRLGSEPLNYPHDYRAERKAADSLFKIRFL